MADCGDVDIDACDDEQALFEMLTSTEDFDARKKIRARIRHIRELKTAEVTRQKRARDAMATGLHDDEEGGASVDHVDGGAEGPMQGEGGGLLAAKQTDADAERMSKVMAQVYHANTDSSEGTGVDQKEGGVGAQADEEEVSKNTKTEKGADGATTVTNTTVTTHRTRDGPSTTVKQTRHITQTSRPGGTSYRVGHTTADQVAHSITQTFQKAARPTTSGVIQVKTEQWSSKDGVTNRTEKTQAWGKPSGPRSARAAFQQLDNAASAGSANLSRPALVQRSPSAIKQMLLDWCKAMTREYEPRVAITNFSSSWNDGMAFCALIHHFYPTAFDFAALDPASRRHNFTLAFETAEREADIVPLLDVDDMVRMKNPDWKCVFCYVQSIYRRLRAQPVVAPAQ